MMIMMIMTITAPGAGPRHLVLHPSLPLAILACELQSRVQVIVVIANIIILFISIIIMQVIIIVIKLSNIITTLPFPHLPRM